MGELLVDGIEADVLEKLQQRARSHGRSAEEEAREILREAVISKSDAQVGLGTQLAEIFHGVGIEEEIPELRGYPFEPFEFDP
jgi:plasmid stability protein